MKKKSKKDMIKKCSNYKNKVFDIPKKPISEFALYVTDKMPNLKKVKSGVPTQIFIK